MAKFMQISIENPKLKQSEIADQLGYSFSLLQRYRNDINMLSPYRILSKITNKRTKKASNTNVDNNSYREPDVKRSRLTSNDLKPFPNDLVRRTSKKRNKNILKGGSVHDNFEINDQNLDENLDIKNI